MNHEAAMAFLFVSIAAALIFGAKAAGSLTRLAAMRRRLREGAPTLRYPGSRESITAAVAWALGIARDRVEVSLAEPLALLVRVPWSTLPWRMADARAALEDSVPVGVVWRLERKPFSCGRSAKSDTPKKGVRP